MSYAVTGLVVAGGESARMGRDKAFLDYHGQPQAFHLYRLLETLCGAVFISCNQRQYEAIPASYNTIPDSPEFLNMGPMTAILSAAATLPGQSILAIGCDYPLLRRADLVALLECFVKENKSVCYRNEDGYPEPLIAVYQENSLKELQHGFSSYRNSLSRFLRQTDAMFLQPEFPDGLRSIDDETAYREVKASLDAAINDKTLNLRK